MAIDGAVYKNKAVKKRLLCYNIGVVYVVDYGLFKIQKNPKSIE